MHQQIKIFINLTIFISTILILLTDFHPSYASFTDDLHGQPGNVADAETREVAMFRFVLGGQRKRLKRSDSKHVIEIYRPKSNQTMIVQISRKYSLLSPNFEVKVDPDLEHNDQIGLEDSSVVNKEDLMHCVYSGRTVSHPGGRVALSSCGFQNSEFTGFRGLITTPNDGHWIVEPDAQGETKGVFPHVLQRPHSSSKRCSSGDFHRPSYASMKTELYDDPDEQFLVYDENEIELEQDEENEEESEDQEEENEEESEEQESREIKNVGILMDVNNKLQEYDDDINGQDNGNRIEQIQMSALTNTNNFKMETKKRKKQKNTSKTRILELAVFSDSKLYEQMKKKYPKNTLKELSKYILAQVNNMNLLYKDPSIGKGNELTIRLNHLEMHTKPNQKLKTGKGKETVYLSSFCGFAAAKNSKSDGWDHGMMLTGVDLRDESSNGVMGVAWTGALCDNAYSCSLVEDLNFMGAYTATHELGHSLGMLHDGEESNWHCNSANYIMAPMAGSGQNTWSSCSQENLKVFLAGKSKVEGATNPKCLKTIAKKKGSVVAYKGKKLPGEIYPATQQCFIHSGSKSKPINTGYYPYDDICRELYCGNDTVKITTQPALEGTTCDKKKWCRGGKCVSKK